MEPRPFGGASVNIVLLTSLWPEAEDTPRDQGTFAVYELVRSWANTENLVVFRLTRTSWNPRRWGNRPWSTLGTVRWVEAPLGNEFPGGRSLVFPTVSWVRAQLAELNFAPDVVVTHFRSSHLMGARLRDLYDGAVHVAGVHQFDLKRLATHASYRRALDRADGVAFRSHSLANRGFALGAGWETKAFIALSGVSSSWIRPPREGLPNHPLVFGTVARLIPRKNVVQVIEALERLETPWEYHVVGDGPERARLEELVVERRLTTRVRFWGARTHEQVREHLDQWDVFAMPSDHETFGLAYLEAMARGCLVVGAVGWGVDGVVRHGENGFLVRPGDRADAEAVFTRISQAEEDQWTAWRHQSHQTIVALTEEATSASYLEFLHTTHLKRSHV